MHIGSCHLNYVLSVGGYITDSIAQCAVVCSILCFKVIAAGAILYDIVSDGSILFRTLHFHPGDDDGVGVSCFSHK